MNFQRFVPDANWLRSAAPRILAFAVWCAFLLRVLYVFAPGSPNVDFSSDSAIPVLMAVEKTPVTLFNVYYFGQDRWGAWPFLVAQLITHVTGFRWSPESVFFLHACWIFSGSLVLAALGKRDRVLIAGSYVFALCLHTETRFMLFRLSQPYAWQTTALLLAWLSLRRVFDGFVPGQALSISRRTARVFLVFFFSFLAVSSSTSSAPFLVTLLAVEVLRALWQPATDRRRTLIVPGLLGFAAVAGGTIAEQLQKAAFHRYAISHYGRDGATNIKVDWGYLAINFGKAWHNIIKLTWWPLYFLPALAGAAWLGAFVYARARQRSELEQRLRAVLADDAAIVVIGGYLVALVNFAIVVLVIHVRLNDYDDRYLTPTSLFAPLCGLVSLSLFAKFLIRRPLLVRRAELGFCAALMVVLAIAFPARGSEKRYLEHKETALALARKAPDGLLMGTYWDTYFFSALAPEHALSSVPFEGDTNRMPWTVGWLREAKSTVVAFGRGSDRGRSPPVTLREYGVSLVLANPHFYEESEYVFARYRLVPADKELLRRSYGPSDFALSRCARLASDDVIEAENCPDGFVVFGPYVSIPGEADVEFSFELEAAQPLRVASDLTSGAGKTTHGSIPERPITVGTSHWSGQSVHIFEPVKGLESRIRVHADGAVSFKIRKLSLSVR